MTEIVYITEWLIPPVVVGLLLGVFIQRTVYPLIDLKTKKRYKKS
jgi:hypothetical protein